MVLDTGLPAASIFLSAASPSRPSCSSALRTASWSCTEKRTVTLPTLTPTAQSTFSFIASACAPPGRDEEPFRDQQETSWQSRCRARAGIDCKGFRVYRARRCGRSFRRASKRPIARSHRRPRGLPACGAQIRLRGSARPRRSGRGRRARRWHGTGRSMQGSRPAIRRGGQSVSLGLLHVNAGVYDRHHSGADRRIAEQERDRGRLRRTQRLAILSDDPVPPGLARHDQINLRQPDRRGHEAIPVLEPVDVEVLA